MRNSYLWLAQLVTGVLIAITLGIHMVWMHLDTILNFLGVELSDPTSWTSMIQRSKEVIWVMLYTMLLSFVLYHALYGLRNIIVELTPSSRVKRIITWSIIILGIVAFAWGSCVPLLLLSR